MQEDIGRHTMNFLNKIKKILSLFYFKKVGHKRAKAEKESKKTLNIKISHI